MFGERYLVSQYVCKGVVSTFAFEWCRAIKHFVDEDAKCPPIYGTCVTTAFDDLRSNILFGAHERVCAKVGDTGFRVDGGQ